MTAAGGGRAREEAARTEKERCLRRPAQNVVATLAGIAHGALIEGVLRARVFAVLRNAVESGDDWLVRAAFDPLRSKIMSDLELDATDGGHMSRPVCAFVGEVMELPWTSETTVEAASRTSSCLSNAAPAKESLSIRKRGMLRELAACSPVANFQRRSPSRGSNLTSSFLS